MPYRITEPQPATPHGAYYVHTGRGGAGNYQASTTSMKAPATSRLPPPPSNGKFLTGRGGSGNVHDAGERPMFFFDEDMERLSANPEPAPVFHIGRGGAGNWSSSSDHSSKRGSTTSESASHSEAARSHLPQFARKSKDSSRSWQSAGSHDDEHPRRVHDGVWRRLSNTFSQRS